MSIIRKRWLAWVAAKAKAKEVAPAVVKKTITPVVVAKKTKKTKTKD